MWKTLPQQGAALHEIRLEGGRHERSVVVIPKTGERVRFTSADVQIATAGRVLVRATTREDGATRVVFSGGELVLERAEVDFAGDEADWDKMWRRARARSRPWWHQDGGDEVDLDWAMAASLVLVARPPPT